MHPRLLAFSFVVAAAAGVCAPARAATFTVTSAADDGRAGTLRDAITQANDETAHPGPDTIDFTIDGTGIPTISLTSLLPEITSPVVIDGSMQTGGAVVISGGGTLDGGLLVGGGASTVRGLVVNGFVTYGIQLAGGGGASPLGGSTVTGCIVGLDATGTVKVGPDMLRGIWVNGSPANTIGGTTTGAGNVISGNGNGVAVEGAASVGNVVEGNVIGLGTNGSPIGNSKAGVRIALGATGTSVGLTSPTGRNVISGNVIGISLRDKETQSNKVLGNYIGTDATGSVAVQNGAGIVIAEANRNTVGGTSSNSGNVVSGNTGVGIDVQNVDEGGNKIFGNLVGTTAAGTAALPNASGIRVLNCTAANHVGTSGGGNVVSGNTGNGVNVSQSSNQFVQGNVIGTSRDGTIAIPNGLNGVQVAGSDNTIGGGTSNLIASNVQSGVAVRSGTGNAITGNRIRDNTGRGIDLGADGFTPNDPHDADGGPNGLQNSPDLTPLLVVGAISVAGTLGTTAGTQVTIEVFSNADCPDGNGQGETSLGSVMVTTDAAGHATFSLSPVDPLPAGRILTATATTRDGDTSEFSPCTAPVGATVTTTTSTTTRPPRTTTTATVTTTTAAGQPTTTAPGGGVTTTTVPPVDGGCPSGASFTSLECRLDALGAAARAATDLGRPGPRILKQLDRATAVTRDADTACADGSVRPARARLRRARRLVTIARALLAPRSRRGSVAAEVSALANDARTIGDDLKTLRLQVRCAVPSVRSR